MRWSYHLIISFSVGSLYLLLTDKMINFINILPWLAGGFLVDIDHILTNGVRNKTLNIKKILKIISKDYHQDKQHIYPFHTLEFALFFGYLITKTVLTWQYMASYTIHLFCDGIKNKRKRNNYSWLKKWSLAYYFKTSRG